MSNKFPIVNNFKFIYGKPQKEKSKYLLEYKDILGFKVFKTTIDKLVYIVFDEKNDLYYNFERMVDDEKNVDTDLEKVIEVIILKKNPVSLT